mmetsp:Transcript_25086/g.37494  ORF Transcript_25086/g.37494 Transcript_25086/m.37494 type:complete len:513 (+) Transcript_25086:39-1577(+)
MNDTSDTQSGNGDDGGIIDNNINNRNHGGISVGEATVHIVRGNLGPGALSLPFAYARAGWASGTVLMLAVIAQAVYSMKLLASIENELVSDIDRNNGQNDGVTFVSESVDDVASRRLNLGEVAERCISTRARRAINLFLFISQSGVCCVFISLVSENVASLVAVWHDRRNRYILLLFPLFASISLLNKFRDMKIISHFGNFAMISVVLVASSAAIAELAHMDNGGEYAKEAAAPQGVPKFLPTVKDLFLIASTSFYAFEGLGIVLPIANSMAQPHKFSNALRRSTIVLFSSYLLLGVTCGIAYHDRIDSGSITAFLANDARDQNAAHWKVLLFNITNALVALAVFLTFPLQLFPAAEVFDQWFCSSFSCQSIYKLCPPNSRNYSDSSSLNLDSTELEQNYIFLPGGNNTSEEAHAHPCNAEKYYWMLRRVLLVAFFTLLTLAVPNVGLIVQLVGSIGSTTLAATPSVCNVSLNVKRNLPIYPLDIAIIIFCGILMVFGTVFAIKDIIDAHSS